MSSTLPKLDLGNELQQKRRERQQADAIMKTLSNRVQLLLHQEEKEWKNIKKNQNAVNKAIIQKELSKLEKIEVRTG